MNCCLCDKPIPDGVPATRHRVSRAQILSFEEGKIAAFERRDRYAPAHVECAWAARKKSDLKRGKTA